MSLSTPGNSKSFFTNFDDRTDYVLVMIGSGYIKVSVSVTPPSNRVALSERSCLIISFRIPEFRISSGIYRKCSRFAANGQ